MEAVQKEAGRRPGIFTIDRHWISVALKAAEEGGDAGEIPVGAVLVCGEDHFVACNLKESKNDPMAHAEILALRKGAEALGRWRLGGTLYVTLEPCLMCAGAILEARVDRLIFGAWDKKAGACGSVHHVMEERVIRHPIHLVGGVCAEESARLLKDFFAARRQTKTGVLDCGEMAELG